MSQFPDELRKEMEARARILPNRTVLTGAFCSKTWFFFCTRLVFLLHSYGRSS